MKAISTGVLDWLYAAFSSEPRPAKIDGCRCCLDDKEVFKLISTPLRDLTDQDLSSYASSVFLTVGSEPDFCYFLPRILEILATTPGWWPSPEVVGRAIGTIPWAEYTPDQQQALAGYFNAVFEALFNSAESDGDEIDSWLCCASNVLPEWPLVLNRLMGYPKALAALAQWHSDDLRRGALGNGFWHDSPKKELFREWFLSDEVQLLLPGSLRS